MKLHEAFAKKTYSSGDPDHFITVWAETIGDGLEHGAYEWMKEKRAAVA